MFKINCHSKINLYLEIQKKREDGYHDIGTLFQALEFGDELKAEPAEGLVLEGADSITSNLDENLILKAAHKIRNKFGINGGIRFRLNKKVPMGAGLGGGSADAAAAVKLCDKIWKLNRPLEDYQSITAELGADVSFFLNPGTQFAEGIGEKLVPAAPPFPFSVLIATPNCFVSTAKAYGSITHYRNQLKAFREDYEEKHKIPQFYSKLSNDFEAPVLASYPEIAELKQKIEAFNPVKTMLSGSGSSLFALFLEDERARRCLAEVQPLCRFSVLTKFLESAQLME